MKKFALFFFIAALLPLNVVSQTPQDPVEKGAAEGQFTLKTATEVVLVNVTVRGKDDNFIKDLKTQDFMRLRVGVGRPERGDPRPLADYVLSDFAPHDDAEALVARAADAVETLETDGIERAQVAVNRR